MPAVERANYLHRSPQTGRYMFGLKLSSLANTSLSGLRIREQAAYLVRLMEHTHLTVHMGGLDQYEAVVIAKYDPPAANVLATWRGQRIGIHCSGMGKALGAYMPVDELQALHRTCRFPRHNENTITSLRKLQKDFTRTRMYSIDDEEGEIGWRCLGAPIFNDCGAVVAAISLAGTTHQIQSDTLPRLAETLRNCALEISYSLGYMKDTHAYKRA